MRWNEAVGRIKPYVGGRPIEEVVREFGVADVVKLASNESPVEPFPEVVEVLAATASEVNRYPDSAVYALTREMADVMDVDPDQLWFGAGSSELIGAIASAVGGPGTSALMAWPSFAMYPIMTMRAGAEPVMVPLDGDQRHDLDAMAAAIDDSTTVVYVCNPNNPTGTVLSGDAVEQFVRGVPDEVLVVVDEAYHEFVTDRAHRSMDELAIELPNVVTLRTFSKVYGLAGLRIGYGIGQAATLLGLRKAQRPFTVTAPAQIAAREAIKHPHRVEGRRLENAAGRRMLMAGLADRGFPPARSETNFVWFETGPMAQQLFEDLQRKGVIVRPFDGAVRVSVGTEVENRRFLMALDQVL